MSVAQTCSRPWRPNQYLPRGSRGLVLGGVRLRRRVKRRALDLDRQLAAGVEPMATDELSLRVGQLGSAETRKRLARALAARLSWPPGSRTRLHGDRVRSRFKRTRRSS